MITGCYPSWAMSASMARHLLAVCTRNCDNILRDGYCSPTGTVETPKIMDRALRLLKALNYRRIGCVEFKRDPRDGQTKLVDNKARAVRKSGIATAAGVDPAWITYHALTSTSRTEPVFNQSVPMRGIGRMGPGCPAP
jgi:predicted ATP-grasp superfamily ATP-dependent carboligase